MDELELLELAPGLGIGAPIRLPRVGGRRMIEALEIRCHEPHDTSLENGAPPEGCAPVAGPVRYGFA